jgi:Leucine-rich repeat (LRR) protein
MNLEHNFIKSVPASIVHFHNIAQLNLAYNQITIVPKEIQSLSSLKDHSLDLSTKFHYSGHNPIEKIENP